jgi:hypothetical protein
MAHQSVSMLVGGNGNDTVTLGTTLMSQQSPPIQGMDYHLLNSALLNFGVSLGGAYQFLQGLPVVGSLADRDALRGMFIKQQVNESTALPALLKLGVSPAGAYQFLQGLPVASKVDRDLVVIAIIAILIGLLLPAVAKEDGPRK